MALLVHCFPLIFFSPDSLLFSFMYMLDTYSKGISSWNNLINSCHHLPFHSFPILSIALLFHWLFGGGQAFVRCYSYCLAIWFSKNNHLFNMGTEPNWHIRCGDLIWKQWRAYVIFFTKENKGCSSCKAWRFIPLSLRIELLLQTHNKSPAVLLSLCF